jgi:hypothetical protein
VQAVAARQAEEDAARAGAVGGEAELDARVGDLELLEARADAVGDEGRGVALAVGGGGLVERFDLAELLEKGGFVLVQGPGSCRAGATR